jgi:hypothetical protein
VALFSEPAQRLGYGLHARQVAFATLCTRGFGSLVASTAALIATGRSEPVPGRGAPAVNQRHSRRASDKALTLIRSLFESCLFSCLFLSLRVSSLTHLSVQPKIIATWLTLSLFLAKPSLTTAS